MTLSKRCWSWSSSTVATRWEESIHWKRPWCWERLKAGGEGDDRGWDGWMASLTRRTCTWSSSGRQWRTEKPGVPQSMGSQTHGHNWATAQQFIDQVDRSLKIQMMWGALKTNCVIEFRPTSHPTRVVFHSCQERRETFIIIDPILGIKHISDYFKGLKSVKYALCQQK